MLQPVVVDVDELVGHEPAEPAEPVEHGPFRVLFASRWDAAKGGELQVEVLDALRSAYGDSIVLEGLDWGEGAPRAARDHGVELRPRMGHDAYARWLATGSVAVGQMSSRPSGAGSRR